MSVELLQMIFSSLRYRGFSIETVKKSAVLDSSGDANIDPYNRGTSRP